MVRSRTEPKVSTKKFDHLDHPTHLIGSTLAGATSSRYHDRHVKPLRKTAIIIVAVAGVLLATALILGPDKARLDADARATSRYDFVELSEGVTEYEVAGPPNGEPVVLIHGLSIPMFDFDRLFEDLAGSGIPRAPVQPVWPRPFGPTPRRL